MTLAAIASLLNQRMGVDPKIIGERKIARAVEIRRMERCLDDIAAYERLLRSSTSEFDELVELLVVPETWFFRDRKPFDFLVDYARSHWQSTSKPIRILSAPCSTGEEPYSIAIALLSAGLSSERFTVDAIDISRVAIAKAQKAIYGKNSFRGEPWIDRDHYFQTVADKYKVCAAVRSLVNFRVANLFNGLATAPVKYDAVFCRNLLIYQEPKACEQILKCLSQILVTDGLLFVGVSETGKIPKDRFASIRQPTVVAHQKIEKKELSPSLSTYSKPVKVEPKSLSQASLVAAAKLIPQTLPQTNVNDLSMTSLDLAEQMANLGHIESAIHYCQAYLAKNSTHVQTYTLLGTLYQARADKPQAERYFRKALYLDPNHYEALMHLALLKEHCGDLHSAELLYQRIQKLSSH